MKNETIQVGATLVYNDGRPGHEGVKAIVLEVGSVAMVVQFEDRADTTTIRFSEAAWMNHIRLA